MAQHMLGKGSVYLTSLDYCLCLSVGFPPKYSTVKALALLRLAKPISFPPYLKSHLVLSNMVVILSCVPTRG